MRLIVTGFEPFGGADVNASWEAVRQLDGAEAARLPVSFARSGDEVRRLVAEGADAVLCVGEAGGRAAICVERVALNWMDARIPDNDGAQPVDERIDPDGPAARFSTLPTRKIVQALWEAGIPAELSYAAGTYVCNSTFYALMAAVERAERPIPGGFIHVPAQGMETGTIVRALEIALEEVRRALGEPDGGRI